MLNRDFIGYFPGLFGNGTNNNFLCTPIRDTVSEANLERWPSG